MMVLILFRLVDRSTLKPSREEMNQNITEKRHEFPGCEVESVLLNNQEPDHSPFCDTVCEAFSFQRV